MFGRLSRRTERAYLEGFVAGLDHGSRQALCRAQAAIRAEFTDIPDVEYYVKDVKALADLLCKVVEEAVNE